MNQTKLTHYLDQAGLDPLPWYRVYPSSHAREKTCESESGFREYGADIVRQVRFIRRAQDLGFTLEEIRGLLALWDDSATSCSAVERRATATLARIGEKIADLGRMKDALTQYVSACRDRAALQECPLLSGLGGMEEDARE